MKVDRKNNIVHLTQDDDGLKLVLSSKKIKDSIGLKIVATNKGFGIEIFSKPEEAAKPKQNLLVFLENKGKPFVVDYVGAWKLNKTLRAKVLKKGVSRPGRKKAKDGRH